MKKTLILAVFLLLGGCVARPWVPVEKPYTNQSQGIRVDLPPNWMREGRVDYLAATRDGYPLQSIYIRKFNISDDPLRNTKKKLEKGMLPHEAAEIVLDHTILEPSLADVKVEKNGPARLDGSPGFRAVYTFKNKSGLKMKAILCGRLKGDSLVIARYMAPQRYYFDLDAPTFERILLSLRITDESKQ